MQVKILEFQNFTVLIEFEDIQGLQRSYIPRDLIKTSVKGPINLDEGIIKKGIPYSDVDLESSLGVELPAISVRDLEQALRKAGLWTRSDYQSNPKVVENVVTRFRRLDVTTILNVAQQGDNK